MFNRHKDPPNIYKKPRKLVDTIPLNTNVLDIGVRTGSTLDSAACDEARDQFASLFMIDLDCGMKTRLEAKLRSRSSAIAAPEAKVDGALPKIPFEDDCIKAVV
ncbi:unnamed protein product [Agarophyton chilense]